MKRPAKPFSRSGLRFRLPGGTVLRGAAMAWTRGMSADTGANQSGSLRRHAIRAAAFLAAMACLLWPAILNSQYIFFYDTAGYLRSAVQAFGVAGIESDWSDLYKSGTDGQSAQTAGEGSENSAPGGASDGFISAARSVYYGAVLYTGELLGSLWIGVLFQTAAVALAVSLSLRVLAGSATQDLPLVLCLLGLFTPLSFFSSYLMPDVFAGIAILGVAGLLAGFDRMRWQARGLWFALLCASLAFQMSHIAIAGLLVLIGMLIIRQATGSTPWKAGGVISAAVAFGLLSQAVFYWTVEAVYGHPPLRPPFLTARVVADGPGYDYLRATCPHNGFKICEFLPVLPLDTDEFLWAKDPQAGVIGPAGPETRRALVEEQTAFVAAVLRYDFPGQIIASLKGVTEQLSRFSMKEFRYPESLREMIIQKLPARHHASFRNTLLYKDQFPLSAVDGLFYIALGVSAVLLIWGLRRLAPAHRAERPKGAPSKPIFKPLSLFVLIVLCGTAYGSCSRS